jgi:hypothetical protein
MAEPGAGAVPIGRSGTSWCTEWRCLSRGFRDPEGRPEIRMTTMAFGFRREYAPVERRIRTLGYGEESSHEGH